MPGSQIFFSYSRSDSAFALKLAADLREAGVKTWLDQLDIPPGKRWDSEVEKALERSNSILVILSPKSVESNSVMDEISYALEEDKAIIPIIINECTIPFRIRRLQNISFIKNYDQGLKQLLKFFETDEEFDIGSFFSDKTEHKNTPLKLPISTKKDGSKVLTLAVGIETLGGVFTKLIPGGSKLPLHATEVFSTAEDNQNGVQIHLLVGESDLAADNTSLGTFNLNGIPDAPRGVPQIEVSFDINTMGILNVTAKDLGTNQQQSITIS